MQLKNALNDDELGSVVDFVNTVDEMKTRSWIKNGLKISFEMKYKDGKLTQEIKGLDEEEFRSFLLDFRKLIAPRSANNWLRVFNILYRNGDTNTAVKEELKKCRDFYTEATNKSFVKIFEGDISYTPEQLSNLWLNGHYFHDDPDKKQLLDSSPVAKEMKKMVFVSMVIDLTKALIIARNILGKMDPSVASQQF